MIQWGSLGGAVKRAERSRRTGQGEDSMETMTREEIITQYEELWRGAALKGVKQMRGVAATLDGRQMFPNEGLHCAWLAPGREKVGRDTDLASASWQCPWCEYPRFAGQGALGDVMIHLNNQHGWTWDQFAGKFRDALVEGEALAKKEGRP